MTNFQIIRKAFEEVAPLLKKFECSADIAGYDAHFFRWYLYGRDYWYEIEVLYDNRITLAFNRDYDSNRRRRVRLEDPDTLVTITKFSEWATKYYPSNTPNLGEFEWN